MARKTTAQSSQFPDRVRFNWGYHNGAAMARKNEPMRYAHYDKVYLAGEHAGMSDYRLGIYEDSSDQAWRSYNAPEAKQSRRMAKYR